MKALTFFILQLLTISGVVVLEFWPNKYIGNIMVIFKAWAVIQALTVWLLLMTFSLKVPSQATINNAIEFTREGGKTGLQKLTTWVMRTFMWIATVVCLTVGQWLLFFCFLAFILGLLNVKKSAKKYLQNVKVDFDKKTAVIDV